MLGPSIKIDKDLYARVKRCADTAGYSSPKEFVQHVLEKELTAIEGDDSDEQLLEKLKGLSFQYEL